MLAGDQLKAASDLGVPVVGVGLLYQQGYFRQGIAADGSRRSSIPYNDPTSCRSARSGTRAASGSHRRPAPGAKLWLRAWQVRSAASRSTCSTATIRLNPPADRGITSELYGAGPELRLRQEILLGIGGWRLLESFASSWRSAI